MVQSRFVLCSLVYISIGTIVCPPVTEKPVLQETPAPMSEQEQENLVNQLSYEKYLKEVMGLLMSEPEFAKKIAEHSSDLGEKSGEIAKHLDFVSHGIRTKLDEIKRKEIDRLRQIMRMQGQIQKGIRAINPDLLPESMREKPDQNKVLKHVDHHNPNTFEVKDLAKLIKQATADLEDIDKKRKQEFKSYELEKEHLRREQLRHLDEAKRREEEAKFAEMQKKHEDHPKLHHPGNEEQLKEVWEDTDGLNKDEFDPVTFFHLHDTNGDGNLDEAEIEALFQKELDKAYDPNAPEDDMMERYEEMNRMREHVMTEVDRNQDKLVSLDEFLASTNADNFKKDEEWETLDQQKVYSDEELAEFEAKLAAAKQDNAGSFAQQPDVLYGRADAPRGVNVMHQQPVHQQPAHHEPAHQQQGINPQEAIHQEHVARQQQAAHHEPAHQPQAVNPQEAIHQEHAARQQQVAHQAPAHQADQNAIPVHAVDNMGQPVPHQPVDQGHHQDGVVQGHQQQPQDHQQPGQDHQQQQQQHHEQPAQQQQHNLPSDHQQGIQQGHV